MNQTKIETPWKDIHGETIKVGDVIIFGMLGQHWKVSQRKRSHKYYSGHIVPKGAFIMTICSNDSGKGFWEEMSDDLEIPENGTEICHEWK